MKSMTGYGRGEAAHAGEKVIVEMTSVNRRQSELSISLPRDWDCFEQRIRDAVNRRIARGRLNVKVFRTVAEATRLPARINFGVARAAVRELTKLARELKLPAEFSIDTVLRIPGVIEETDPLEDTEQWGTVLNRAVNRALDDMVAMRAREGAHLHRDLRKRMNAMKAAVRRVRQTAPKMVERFRGALRERIQAAGLETPVPDDERLAKEIVYFADRSDISEELARLRSHFQQFESLGDSDEPVGRALDFLAQEMNREINTIGSKANDREISADVVTLKAELEKFREQVQNVE